MILVSTIGFTVACAPTRTTEISMYDGRKWVDRLQVPDPSTTFIVTMCDEGKRNTIDDEWCVDYAFSIPDEGKRVLPVTFRNLSGTQTISSIWSSESTPFSDGTFTLTSAVPGGFVASFDFGAGTQRAVGRGRVRPEGQRRVEIWPYDLREPRPSHLNHFVQLVKDAWNGAI